MFVPLRYNTFYRFTTGVWQKNIEKELIRKRTSIFDICFMAAFHPLAPLYLSPNKKTLICIPEGKTNKRLTACTFCSVVFNAYSFIRISRISPLMQMDLSMISSGA